MAGTVKLIPFDDYVNVVAVSGGKNTVKFPGKTELVDNVPSTNPCIPGQWLPMRKINGDRQQPILISPRRKRKKVGWTLSDAVSSLNWHSWRSALYRGGWSNTNVLPNLSNAETTLYTHPNPEGTAPTFGNSKIHDGYMYGTEYYASYDNRLIRISLADGTKTYATWTGDTLVATPADIMLAVEDDVLYAYVIYQGGYGGYGLYRGKYNLDTMARVYLSSETFFNTSRTIWRRIFCDDTYFYIVFYDGGWERYEFIRKFNRITGAYVGNSTIAWSFDYQTNNYGYLCYASEIRASIEPKSGSGILFPTLGNQGTSNVIYEVPGIRLTDGGVAWNYAPTSKTLSRAWFSYVIEWYCYEMSSLYGLYFTQRYCTAQSLYYFTGCSDGDKQIRNTLIACNDTYAVVLAEETTIKQNTTYRSWDDWQQTVWKETEWPVGNSIERYVDEGQGAPGMMPAEFTAMVNGIMSSFDSLTFDDGYLPFQWIDRKEVFLRILDITTGEQIAEYGFSASEEDTGGTDDLVVPRLDLVSEIRVCSAMQFVGRTKADGETYSGPAFREMMGIEDDEEVYNAVTAIITDFWTPEYDPDYGFDHYWSGCYTGVGSWGGAYWWADEYGAAIQGQELGVQDESPAESIPTRPGRWHYKCVAAKHPTEDVTFHTEKYIPTKFDFAKTLITDTYLFIAPDADASGRMACFKINISVTPHTITLLWSIDVGPGSELLHWCCNSTRIYYFRGATRTNCTLYEINVITGTIVTTKTGVSVSDPTTGYFEPMVVDNKIVLTDNKKLSYYGQ